MRAIGQRGWWGLVTVAALACHESAPLQGVEATAAFDPSALDFGEVPVGEWRVAEVRIHNVGRVPFLAVEALGLTGNPSFVIELDPGKVQPGDTRAVRVRFHPLHEGETQEQIHVATDADNERSRQLFARGVGAPARVRIWPERVDFETLELDSERTLTFTVHNPVDLPLSLSLSGDLDQFDTGAVNVAPLTTQEVAVRYRPGRLGASSARAEARACPSCTPASTQLGGNAVPSAFVFDPNPVPFEEVPVHERTRSRTQATNITWRPVEIQRLEASDASFSALHPLTGQVVGPQESVEVDLEFAARHSGPSVASLRVVYLSDRERFSEVVLDARGGRARLALAPATIDFGELPVGGKVERVLRLTNAGTSGDLHLHGVRATGDTAHFSVSVPFRAGAPLAWSSGTAWPSLAAPALPIAPGSDGIDLRVSFAPMREGALRAELVVLTDDLFEPERVVVLTGRARPIGPCVFRVLPQGVLDFGNVPTGAGAVLGFRFENAGTEECAVKDIHLSDDAGGAFFMPGGPLAGGVVLRDDSFAAQIAFRAPTDGAYAGELSITVSDPVAPTFHLPLRAVAKASCLVAAPPFMDFGPIRYDCAPVPRKVLVSNRCGLPLTLDQVWIGQGTSLQFSLTTSPTLPLTLAPGAGFELEGTYARTVHGQHYSPLFVQAVGESEPLLIPMLAETNHEGVEVETFVQGTDRQLDVLLVVSNATTMGSYQRRLAAQAQAWLAEATRQGVDLRVGVTTTGLVSRPASCFTAGNGGEAGRLFPVDGSRARVVSSASPTAAAQLSQNLDVGQCHNLVQGLETMRAALMPPLIDSTDDVRTSEPNDGNAGFLRAAARLAVLFLADEDDHSGFEPESYVQLLVSLKGPNMGHRVSAYALVPLDAGCLTAGPPGPRFADVALRTGGAVRSICEASYLPLLGQLTARAAGQQADFRLSATPSSVGEISVRVDGVEVPRATWSYDSAANAVVFAPGSVPAPGQTIQVRYRSACIR
ncbi:MAG: choice-of-anchor D domain-containing protein [Myxococcota bacterium]